MTIPSAGLVVAPPLGLLAELTHRCPLAVRIRSNSAYVLEDRAHELDTSMWARVFDEAVALGVLQVPPSGGEPASTAATCQRSSLWRMTSAFIQI